MRDLDIRSVLREQLNERHRGDSDTLIINELGLCAGSVRVDVAVVNGAISGYEIKSESDTLDRLPVQSQIYSQALDYVTIVTGENHLEGIHRLVPDWWGICVATSVGDSVAIEEARRAEPNPRVDPESLVQFLWRDEALDLLKERGLAKGFLGKPRKVLWTKLAQSIPPDQLGDLVRSRLKARRDWLSDQQRTSGDA